MSFKLLLGKTCFASLSQNTSVNLQILWKTDICCILKAYECMCVCGRWESMIRNVWLSRTSGLFIFSTYKSARIEESLSAMQESVCCSCCEELKLVTHTHRHTYIWLSPVTVLWLARIVHNAIAASVEAAAAAVRQQRHLRGAASSEPVCPKTLSEPSPISWFLVLSTWGFYPS